MSDHGTPGGGTTPAAAVRGTVAGSGTPSATPAVPQDHSSISMKDVKMDCGPLTNHNFQTWLTSLEAYAMIMGISDALTSSVAPLANQQQAKLIMLKNVTEISDIEILSKNTSAAICLDRLKKSRAAGSAAQKSLLIAKESNLSPTNGETLAKYVDRCKLLHSELSRLKMLNEERFLLVFLNGFQDIPLFSSWAQTVDLTSATFHEVAAKLISRNLHTMDQPLKGRARTTNESSALQVSSKGCDFCGNPNHTTFKCYAYNRHKKQHEVERQQRGTKNNNNKKSTANKATASCLVACHAVSRATAASWIIDSGATDHMTNNFDALSDVVHMKGECLLATEQKVPILAKGSVVIRNRSGLEYKLQNVLYVPDLHVNLVSLSKALTAGFRLSDTKRGLRLRNSAGSLDANLTDDLFVLDCTFADESSAQTSTTAAHTTKADPPAHASTSKAAQTTKADPPAPASTTAQLSQAQLFHRRMGHKGMSTLANMSAKSAVTGLPPAQHFRDALKSNSVCPPCAEGKATRQPFPSAAKKSTAPLEKLHVDIATGMPLSKSGLRNFVAIVDDFTGYKIVGAIHAKSDAPDFIKDTVRMLEARYAKFKYKVQQLRSDKDSVFMSHDFKRWMKDNAISFEPTSGYSPAENGHAERALRTLGETFQAMLSDAGVDRSMWAECLMHAVYLTNISSTDGSTTPWELLKGEKPDISNLHVWGCLAWVNVPKTLRKKKEMPPKSDAGIFLGFDGANHKAYRIRMPSGKVVTSRDVLFDESAPPASTVSRDDFSDIMLPTPPAQPPPGPATIRLPQPQPQTSSQHSPPSSASSDESGRKSVRFQTPTLVQHPTRIPSTPAAPAPPAAPAAPAPQPAPALAAPAPPPAPAAPAPEPAPASDGTRRSTRSKQPPVDPYKKWTLWPENRVNTATAAAEEGEYFSLVGSLLSPLP